MYSLLYFDGNESLPCNIYIVRFVLCNATCALLTLRKAYTLVLIALDFSSSNESAGGGKEYYDDMILCKYIFYMFQRG